jgi:hypothetical protein
MASPQASDPANSTVATDIAWVDMRDYENFAALVFTSSLGGNGPTVFTIVANSQSNGGGTDAVIKSHAVGSAPDAVGDFLVLECTDKELAQESTSTTGELRYVSAKVTCHHTDDEAVVVYLRGGAKRAADGLTADYVSS